MAAAAPTLEQILDALVAERVERAVAPLRLELERLRAANPSDDLDTAAAADLARVTPDTIREWIRRRGLRATRPPGARDHRIARADLLAFLASPARRPPRRGPVDLAAEAGRILTRSRRG